MVLLPISSEVELPVLTPAIDFGIFSTAELDGRGYTGQDRPRPSWSIHGADRGAGGSVERAPQARAGKSELPSTAWLIPGALMRPSPFLSVPLTCIAV